MLHLLTLERLLILLFEHNFWAILRKNGLKGKKYQAIVNMYDVVKSKVRAGNDLTESFMCPRGLK